MPPSCSGGVPPSGTLLGCVWVEPQGDGIWYLGSLAIDPPAQNGGLGRALLAAAEDWIRDRGGQEVRMTVVNVRETLLAWYARRGYIATGETKPFPYGDDRFGIPKRERPAFRGASQTALTTSPHSDEVRSAGAPGDQPWAHHPLN